MQTQVIYFTMARRAASCGAIRLLVLLTLVTLTGHARPLWAEDEPLASTIYISGRVVGKDGIASEAARVMLGDWYTQGKEGDTVQSGLTTANGTYRVALDRRLCPPRDSYTLVRVWAEAGGRRSPERVLRISGGASSFLLNQAEFVGLRGVMSP